ncbi:GTPase-activating protein and VPS9 domain-containing protein 1-like isoform X1 [Varroa jacobsoni]|uniref:GTPase-activating protein and VPS9 domain-containing protein 1-like isoform X1 n=1 Tax=Varroa jacobsoni TaxID=62625 RepID=UPI000BF2D74D|nr:GTPase-activating protein and VPS9 domain-containing protein 1-like isoform X1 [Varroa jacobsoni]
MARVACRELLELVHSLRQEQLFVSAEKRKIHQLNDEVRRCSDRLFERAWTARHQRINLDRYILSMQDIQSAHRKAVQLDGVHFVDSYKRLGNADPPVSDLIKALRENPKLLALFLDRCEQIKVSAPTLQHLISGVMISLYGACLLSEDNNYALVLLYELMHLQLPRTDQLRRLLQNGSCTFSRCYKAFVEAHLPAKLFLTSALRNAIIQVLVNDDLYLDIEPNSAVVRFAPEERMRHFGPEGTPQYESSLRTYRAWSIRKLTALAQLFLDGISESMFCFPPALAWLVRQFYGIILDENKIEPRQIAVICADLVFYFFICPAIVNPELYGVIEEGLHIGQCARFNLIQVARIIQVLAMARYEPIDERLEEVYRHFDKELLPNILEEIIRGSQQTDLLSDLLNGSAVNTDPSVNTQDNSGPLTRNAVLISTAELQDLVSTLHQVLDLESNGSLLREWLQPIMEHVPTHLPLNIQGTNNHNGHSMEDGTLKMALMTKVSRMRNPGQRGSQHAIALDGSSNETADEFSAKDSNDVITEVLVVSLPNPGRREFPGAMPEEKVLSLEQSKRSATKVRLNLDNLEEKSSTGSGKRTRFFGDQESIAGASDNLEAGLSEAASVASSLDIEENADNLSDMVSANVSGPGTPSVSGRDTPSSHGAAPVPPHPAQIAEQLQLLQGGGNQAEQPQLAVQAQIPTPANIPSRRRAPPRPEAQKQMDIEDRFGRFGISNGSGIGSSVAEEETKSMVSDTWSTDVLGSDSEAHYGSGAGGGVPSAHEQQLHIESHLNAMQQHIHGHLSQHNVNAMQQQQQQLIELSETQSDAWSTAAMTSYSDLDRLQEVDPEDDLLMMMPSERRRSAEDVGASMDVGPGEPENGAGMFVGRVVRDNVGNGGGCADRQSTPTNLIKLNSNDGDEPPPLIDVGDNASAVRLRGANSRQQALSGVSADTPLVETDPPQQDDLLSGAFAHSLSNGSVASFGSSTPFGSVIEAAAQGSQSLGRLSFAMKEHSPSRENLLDRDLTQFNNGSVLDNGSSVVAVALPVKPQGSADSSDGNSESSSDLLGGIAGPVGAGVVSGRSSGPGSAGDDSERQVQMRSGAIPKTPRIQLQQQQISSSDRASGGGSGGRHNRQSGGSGQRGFLRKFGNIKQSISSKVKTLDRNSGFRRFTPDLDNGGTIHDEAGPLGADHQIVGAMPTPTVQFMDASEILEKYRGKNRGDAEAPGGGLMADNASSVSGGDLLELDESEASEQSPEEVAFLDAKRKLRTVFANGNIQTLHLDRSRVELLLLLKMMLAESVGLQNHQQTAQLHEAIRCVSKLDSSMQERVLYAMREDYRQRAAYVSYLVRARQGLESTLAGLQTLLSHVKKDKSVSHGYLTAQCVLEFLQIVRRKEIGLSLEGLVFEFKDLDVSDEKAVLVEKYLERLYKEMSAHPLWHASTEEYLALSESTLERLVMGKLYLHALFPNGDIDLHRDQVLTAHMRKLAQVITPQHRALRIPRGYLLECPWPSAQAAIATLNAYKAPRDKLSCVFLCCKTILDLLHLASSSAAAADDLFPILVYVLIQANPQYLLSNIEYVKHFCSGYQDGEAGYYWTMLDSAVVFIKSLEYN